MKFTDQHFSCFSDTIQGGGLIPIWAKLNFAVLPIGDNFTVDATDAAECARIISCITIFGVHYDTFGFININREEAKKPLPQQVQPFIWY
jgi:L-ascorbate metabolism protein UlaG (beta-lactamase superfamily)